MPQDDTKKLEMRIAELENTIKQLVESRQAAGTTSQAAHVSPADLETYLKVKGIVEPGHCAACLMGCVQLCLVGCIRLCILGCVRECFGSGSGGTGGGTGGEGGGFGSLGG